MLANYIGNWPCSADHPADLTEISEFIIFVFMDEELGDLTTLSILW